MSKYSTTAGLGILVSITILLASGWVYFIQTNPNNQSVVVDSLVHATPITQTVSEPKGNKNKMLLGDQALYKNLSEEEKSIVKEYSKRYLKDPDLPWKDSQYYLWDGCMLKYYDLIRALIACPSGKEMTSPSFSLVNRNNMTIEISSSSPYFSGPYGGYAESDKYAIAVNDYGIYYYKAGDSKISNVPNSEPVSGETYVELAGPQDNEYEVAFDELTRTLTVSVYKLTNGYPDYNQTNQKIRTVKFVLP